jgi:purine-cytosine permease-like protein
MNHQTYPWTSFTILIAIGSIALFLALPRPLKLTWFLISVVVLGIIIGVGLFLSEKTGLKPLIINRNSFGNNLQKLLKALGWASLIGVGLGTDILLTISLPYKMKKDQS